MERKEGDEKRKECEALLIGREDGDERYKTSRRRSSMKAEE
jgi:hypothetical protein